MFEENKFKIELISGLPEDDDCATDVVPWLICRGPHLPDTGG